MIVNQPKSKVVVEDTIAYRSTSLESQLFNDKVQKIFNSFSKDNKNSIIQGNAIIRANFFEDYEPIIKETYRNHIENIYRFGSEYVISSINKQHFATVKDVANIDRITEEAIKSFKRIVERDLTRNRDISFSEIQEDLYKQIKLQIQGNFDMSFKMKTNKTPEKLSPEKQIKNHIDTVSFLSLNTAIVEKVRQVKEQVNPPIYFKGQPEDAVLQRFARQQILPAIVWVTKKDEMVCPICRPMNGLIFRLDDFNIPIPPINSHSNCRCRIFLFNLSSNQTLVDLSV